jgi:hypothetical protein
MKNVIKFWRDSAAGLVELLDNPAIGEFLDAVDELPEGPALTAAMQSMVEAVQTMPQTAAVVELFTAYAGEVTRAWGVVEEEVNK